MLTSCKVSRVTGALSASVSAYSQIDAAAAAHAILGTDQNIITLSDNPPNIEDKPK